jgi:DNA repair protein RecN (Recombination protein N)
MLRALSIRDVVLIDRLDLTFRPGLSVLTGETGAGKSILLDALGLALGARADSGLVRHGADQASVSAEFDLPAGHPALALLAGQGIDRDEGGGLVLRRVLARDGRSRAFVNDQPASVSLLRQLGGLLVEIEGQFAEQGLLDPRTHRGTLDSFAGLEAHVAATRAAWRALADAEAALAAEERERTRLGVEETALRLALEELNALGPKAGEEEELASERSLLMNREQLVEAINAALAHLGGAGERGAAQAIGQAERALAHVAAKASGRLDEALGALERARIEVAEAESALQSFGSSLDHDAGRLETVEERLFALRELARKHGVESAALSDFRDRLAAELSAYEGRAEDLPRLTRERDEARARYDAAARQLGRRRRKGAQDLDRRVAAELAPLKLDKAVFRTEIVELPPQEWSENGAERVAFLVSTNPAAPPAPIERVASGGELARFLLALKVVAAGEGAAETLVFDEVDRGIGGAVAAAVGERLDRLGERLQVLVVTHSPQVAARGRQHHRVQKATLGKTAVTVRVEALEGAERREEIARMLSGARITDEARAQAARLLEPAGASEAVS